MGWRMAIDFGTSNTAAAVWLDGAPAPAVVRLDDNSDQMPSAVLVTESDQIWVGRAATRQAAVQPERFLANPKTYLGESAWQFGDRTVPVPLLVAAVLERAVRRAREYAGGTNPDHVVLTHPEQWKGHRTAQLREAARLAGLGEVTLVSEPVAAATAYATAIDGLDLVAVGDLGAGTCDVAVLERESSGAYRVLASDGEPVGGDHLDAALVAMVLGELDSSGHDDTAQGLRLERRTTGPERRAASRLLALRADVREAKHHLAEYPHASLNAGTATITITDRQLADTAEPVVDRFVTLTRRVLTEAGTPLEALGAYYLTGGSSRLRAVPDRLTPLLGQPPQLKLDPKTVTVLGALQWLEAQGTPAAGSSAIALAVAKPEPTTGDQTRLAAPAAVAPPPRDQEPARPPMPDYLFRPEGDTSARSAGSARSVASPPPPPTEAPTPAVSPPGPPGEPEPTSFLSATFGPRTPAAEASGPAPRSTPGRTAHAATAVPSTRRRRVRVLPLVAIVVLAALLAGGLWWWRAGGGPLPFAGGSRTPIPAAPAPSAAPTGQPTPTPEPWAQQASFRTQSRNIVCTFRARAKDRSDAEVVCTALSNDWQKSTPPADCTADRWDHTIRLTAGGRGEMVCTEAIPPDAPVSDYGDSPSFGSLRCDVSWRGVTCRNGKRTFFVARETWTVS
ncbi:Hsp70 family protein [Mariniluteicoccus flavus]